MQTNTLNNVVNSPYIVTLRAYRDDRKGGATIVVPEKNSTLQERKCAELPSEVTG